MHVALLKPHTHNYPHNEVVHESHIIISIPFFFFFFFLTTYFETAPFSASSSCLNETPTFSVKCSTTTTCYAVEAKAALKAIPCKSDLPLRFFARGSEKNWLLGGLTRSLASKHKGSNCSQQITLFVFLWHQAHCWTKFQMHDMRFVIVIRYQCIIHTTLMLYVAMYRKIAQISRSPI